MVQKKNKAEEAPKLMALIRVRGRTHIRKSIADTLKMLNLTRVNHCSLVYGKAQFGGMLAMAKDYITWGEINDKTLAHLLKERARIIGDKPLTDEYVKKNSKQDSVKSLAEALMSGKAKLKDVEGLKKVFRLSPPRKGYEKAGVKVPYASHGALGYRSEKINDLIERMI